LSTAEPVPNVTPASSGDRGVGGGGEMAARVGALDWSRTPLGPMDGWPQSLRTAVGICLNSRFPMFVWWGPDLINIYNDAYVPVLGGRHPDALGRAAQSIWAEIWPVVGPQADAVMRRGESTWNEHVLLVMERNGYTEDTYFTWSYSPIPDESGGIGGLFCACTEETHRVHAEAERDRLLAQLAAERARLADVFQRSPSFMAVLRGPRHVFELTNDRYDQLVGHRPLIGRPAREALPEVEGQGFFELLDRVYATGEPFVAAERPVRLQRQPGQPLEERVLEFVYQPTREADGSVSGVFAHGVDLTDRRRAEERLARDATLLANVRDSVIVTDLAGVVTFWNEGATRLFGFEASEMLGRPLADRLPEPERAAVTEWIARNAAGEAVFDGEWLDHRRDGSRVWLEATTRLIADAGGNPIGIMGVSRDISERKHAEVARRQSEAEFRLLADAMPQIVWAARPDGVLDYYNRRWFDYIRVPEGAAAEAAWDRHVHPDDLAGTYDAWRAALHSGDPYAVEFRVRGADGAYRWFLARALPIRDDDGRVVRWFGTCTDIHDQKQLRDRYAELLESERAARTEAERTGRIKDDFLATLSHELRTPLNAILGWSQILRHGPPDAADLAEGLETIERNARAQTQIIEDLLDMSRIISGKLRLDVQQVDLAAVVHAAMETLRPAADAKGIRLQGALDPRASAVSGDPNRLQQVFWNLLSNAVKFTPRGGRVQVVLRRVNSHLEVAVADTGQGIKPEFLPRVFDRFRQADASTTRQHGGLGLGLSIVQQLVELHGGTVHVASDGPGRGATFTVALPLAAVQAGRGAGPDSARDGHGGGAAAGGLSPDLYRDARAQLDGVRVLVVDDEADARMLVKRLLEDCAATVTTASGADEAVRLVAAERPHVLVSDVGMPGEDGYSLIRRVRALGADGGGDVPALALTAYARAEDRVRAVRAGFQTHVVKPVEPAELITMVASLVGRTGGNSRADG
jgi:PAS domain S-box-containing protein